MSRDPLTYASLVEYVARRLDEHGEADALLCVARLERNLGLDKNKLLKAARAHIAESKSTASKG